MPSDNKVSDVFVITLYDDADYSAHIEELQKVIRVENARVATGESETTAVSYVDFKIFMESGRPLYTGSFSKPVLRWIRAREEVKRVEEDFSVRFAP